MEITVKIQGTEGLESALMQLAQAIAGVKQGINLSNQATGAPQGIAQSQQQFVPPVPQQTQISAPGYPQQGVMQQYTAPVQQAPPIQQTAPIQQAVPAGQQTPQVSVPTSHTAQSYTQDQIAVAMTALCDAGKVDSVMAILSQFGAETLMQVPKDQYPALATMLRGAGANI